MLYTERSKVCCDTASTESLARMASRSLMSVSVFTTAPWAIITPLGTPVEPDVKMT